MIVTSRNIIPFSLYFTARKCIEHTWLNDCDQYLWPNDDWENDRDFQTDCLTYTIFSSSNNIKSADGINHLIPFAEAEVGARDKYASHFFLDYMAGKRQTESAPSVDSLPGFGGQASGINGPLVFTTEAQAVFDTARELWRYYHTREDSNPNASFYDIREYFQGRNAKGAMNPGSDDEKYMELLDSFKQAYKQLSTNIEPKIYRYGFLQK